MFCGVGGVVVVGRIFLPPRPRHHPRLYDIPVPYSVAAAPSILRGLRRRHAGITTLTPLLPSTTPSDSDSGFGSHRMVSGDVDPIRCGPSPPRGRSLYDRGDGEEEYGVIYVSRHNDSLISASEKRSYCRDHLGYRRDRCVAQRLT